MGDDAKGELYVFGDYLGWADLKPYLRSDMPIDPTTLKFAQLNALPTVPFSP